MTTYRSTMLADRGGVRRLAVETTAFGTDPDRAAVDVTQFAGSAVLDAIGGYLLPGTMSELRFWSDGVVTAPDPGAPSRPVPEEHRRTGFGGPREV